MRAVIYARYSSQMQKETSIDDQVRECSAYAEKQGIQIIGQYLDYEQSGRTDQREEFQRMLKDAQRQLFDRVIVYELTRFARNKYESAINKYHLKKHDVKVISATEQIPDTPEGVLIETLLEGIAEYQSLNLAKNFMRGKMGVAMQCKHTGGRPLLGYQVLPDKSYAIDEDGAAAVKLLFDMYARGAGYSEIIDTLNNKGYKTAAGRSFGKNSLHELLKNERYIGTYTFNKIAASHNGQRSSRKIKNEDEIVRIENGIPAIIDNGTWERVQKRMQANKKAPARTKANTNYLLTGKIFCGKCEGAMVGQPSTSRAGIYYYYSCCTKKRLRTCDKSNIKKDWIEELVLKHLRLSLTDENIDYISTMGVEVQVNNADQQREIARMSKQLEDVRKALANIMTAIEQGIFTENTRTRIEELEAEKAQLENAMNLAQFTHHVNVTKEGITDWLKQFQQCEDDQMLIDFFLKAVYVYDDEILIAGNFDRDDGTRIKISELKNGADMMGNKLSAPSLDRLTEPIEGFFFVWKYGAAFVLKLPISNTFLTRRFILFFPGFF